MSFLVTKVAWVRVPSHSSFFLPFLATSGNTGQCGSVTPKPCAAGTGRIVAMETIVVEISPVKSHFWAGFKRVIEASRSILTL
jgi:hypothetical protein